MTPTTLLRPETLSKIQSLIEINIDSVKGFRQAADQIKNAAISQMFRVAADTREGFASELQRLVLAGGEKPETTGTTMGTMHRWWLDLRSTIADGDEHAVLSEVERGEDAIKHRYEEVLSDTFGQPVHDVLVRQLESVRRTHDRVRDMRDQTAPK